MINKRIFIATIIFLLLLNSLVSPLIIYAEQLDSHSTIIEDREITQEEDVFLDNEEDSFQDDKSLEDKTSSEEQALEESAESKIIEKPSKNQIEKDNSKELESMEKSSIIKENIITNVTLTLANGDALPERMPHPSEETLDLLIKYEFKLPKEHQYRTNATYTFDLPDVFHIYHDTTGHLINGNGTTFGQYKLSTDGTVTMIFNNEIEKADDVSGFINIQTEIREDLSGSTNQVIEFTVQDNNIIRYPIQFEPKKGSAIEMKGTPDKTYNTQLITWEIDINKKLQSIKTAELFNQLEEKLELIPNSLSIYELDVQLDGSVKLGKDVTDTLGKTFPLSFGDIQKAYRVVFETKITDETHKTYYNEAVLKGGNIEDISAKATVSVKRGEPLEKRAIRYSMENETITWEVKYNYNEQIIKQNEAFLVNTFDEGQELVANSVTVEKVEIREDGTEGKTRPVSNFAINTEDNILKLHFKQDIDEAYKVTYQTKLTNRIEQSKYVTNYVRDGKGHETSARQWVTQQVLNKYHLSHTTDYHAKLTKWRLSINNDARTMRHVVIQDFLPKGLELESYKLFYNGKPISEKNYKFKYNNHTGEIRIQLIGHLSRINKPMYIEYETSFNYSELKENNTSFLNIANMTWLDEFGNKKEKKDRAIFYPNQYTKDNGFKNGYYDAENKEIIWEIGVNYNYYELTEAVIENIVQSQQNINLASIEVYKADITPTGQWVKNSTPLKYDHDYKVNLTSDLSFNVVLGEMKGPYIIVYRTTLEGQKIGSHYNNSTALKDGEETISELQASASIPYGGKYLFKEATQNKEKPRLLNWTVTINPTQSTLSNVMLEDQPSNNQVFLKDSFQVFEVDVNKKGNMTKNKDKPLIRGKDYQVVIKDDKQGHSYFEIVFKEKINRPYILEYDTYMMAGHNEYVHNQATLTANELTDGEATTEHRHRVKLTGSDGGVDSRFGRIDITKVDAQTKRPLKGAEFTLYNSSGDIAIKSVTTDSKGQATFKDVLYGDYIIKETKAPEGYISKKNYKTITLEQETYRLIVENEKMIQAFELLNIDAQSERPIGGAIFNLEKKVSGQYKRIAQLTTNQKGLIYKDQLKPGQYRLIEEQAAPGYQSNKKPLTFIIKPNQTEVIRLTSKNWQLGSVELTKYNADDASELLPNAKFHLLDKDGTVIHKALRTNDEGKIIVTHLQPGIYQFVEVKAPDYFELDPTPIEFEIKAKEVDTVKVNAPNHLLTGQVVFNLVDKDDRNIKLQGAIYKLVQEDGQVIKKRLLTDNDGQIIVKDLQPGSYELIEIQAPKHYQSSKKKYKFTIERNKTDQNTVEINAENQLIPGAAEIVKVDKANQKLKLSNAVFELRDQRGHLIKKDLVTDSQGRLSLTHLRPGVYQLVETKAPAGYQLDSDPIKFEIKKSQKKPISIIVENELLTGSIMLSVVDKRHHRLKLKGAVFELRDMDGHVIQSSLTTDRNGILFIDNLYPGLYHLIEVFAPFGYQIDSTPIQFEIIKGQTSPLKLQMQKRLRTEEQMQVQNTIKWLEQNKSIQINDENHLIQEQAAFVKDKWMNHSQFSNSQILDNNKDKETKRENKSDDLVTKSSDHTKKQQSIFDERLLSYLLFSGSVFIILSAVFLYFRVK